MDTTNLQNYLNSFAKEVVKESKGMLYKAKGDTDLAKSIRATVTKDANGFVVKFYMYDYGTFLDKGVSGNKQKRSYTDYKGVKESSPYSYTTKQPPPDILSKWIKKKGIKPKGLGRGRDKNTGRFISNLAFIIGKKIKAKGIKSISFFQVPFGIQYKTLGENILNEYAQDITTYLTTFTKNK